MPIIARVPEGEFEREPMPLGTQHAVCAFVEDVGIQKVAWNGQEKFVHKVVICWELSKKMQNGDNAGKPFMISKRYTLSLFQNSALTRDLESWLGRSLTAEELENGYDIEQLKGKNCLLTIVKEEKGDKTYTNVVSVSPVMEGMPILEVYNTSHPEWISNLRMQSVDQKEVVGDGGNARNEKYKTVRQLLNQEGINVKDVVANLPNHFNGKTDMKEIIDTDYEELIKKIKNGDILLPF